MVLGAEQLWGIALTVTTVVIVPYVRYLSKKLEDQDKQLVRVVTILEEREERRAEDRANLAQSIDRLQKAIEKLEMRLDKESR